MEGFQASLAKAKETQKQNALQSYNDSGEPETEIDPGRVESTSLPEPTHLTPDDEGWVTLDKPLLYVYAGQGPYVAPELMQFPVSLPDDGMIDIAVQTIVNIPASSLPILLIRTRQGEPEITPQDDGWG